MQTPQLQPNEGQKAATEAFFDFLFTDQTEFIISGGAGVGKSTLMTMLIDTVIPKYQKTCQLLGIKATYDSVVLTATTNKAAEVLASTLKRPTETIHSFMNIRVTEDYSTGQTSLAPSKNWKVHNNTIIFIDECSMIDSDLYRFIQEGTEKCKIVYVGDHNQLPPLFEKVSPIYSKNLPFFELTEQMRNNAQPALMEVCAQLRETVDTGIFKPIKVVPGVIDLLSDIDIQLELTDTFGIDKHPSSRVLAYTNNQVSDYNAYIRSQRVLPENLTIGEVLVLGQPVIVGKNVTIPTESLVTVKHDHGYQDLLIDDHANVTLKVQQITGECYDGSLHTLNVIADRDHYNKLIKHYAKVKNWERYFFLKQRIADLRPTDASTVHKAQGSTFDTVFIDLTNISTVTNPNIAARMLYVAFSRAKHRVFLYGNLAEKYGGLIRN